MKTTWPEKVEPLLKQYQGEKHPLNYANRYQQVIMIVLSAQDSDKHINEVAKDFFKQYPTMSELALARIEDLQQIIGSVRNFNNKSVWLTQLAKIVGDDYNIPTKLDDLTRLPGIGRKSANVIIRESGGQAEGIIVDLHVLRVAPRLGVAEGNKPEKIESQLMSVFPKTQWNDIGMAMSFLGREICRPTNPKCTICVMNSVCSFYHLGK